MLHRKEAMLKYCLLNWNTGTVALGHTTALKLILGAPFRASDPINETVALRAQNYEV